MNLLNPHIVIIILYGLAGEVEDSSRYDTLTDEVADLKVCSQDGLRVLVLKTSKLHYQQEKKKRKAAGWKKGAETHQLSAFWNCKPKGQIKELETIT